MVSSQVCITVTVSVTLINRQKKSLLTEPKEPNNLLTKENNKCYYSTEVKFLMHNENQWFFFPFKEILRLKD